MTIWIRKEKAGNASGGLSWPHDGAVIPVDDELAWELLYIPGFSEVAPPPERVAVTEPDPGAHTGTEGPAVLPGAVTEPAPPASPKTPKTGPRQRIKE